MASKVALVRCTSYDYPKVLEAVRHGVDLLGGPSALFKPGEKLLLKPNFLAGDPPEAGTTTHYTVFRAMGEVLKADNHPLSYGDSPAFQSPKSVAEKCGVAKQADELGIPLSDFVTPVEVKFPEGRQNKVFTLAKGAVEDGRIVSLSKMKVHAFQRITGAIKNQFGCIPGILKGEYHVKLPNAYEFAKMLVDLNMLLKPALFLMDGVLAMEGNGPRGGVLTPMNVLLFSTDPVALDATVCRMLNHDPSMVPTVQFGGESGLGNWKDADIEIVGESLSTFVKPGFDIPRSPLRAVAPGGIMRAISNLLVPRPVIDPKICIKCGICVNMCPVNPKAVDWHDGNKKNPPTYKYDRCIRCYCCQETCPEHAISLRKPLIRRIFGGRRAKKAVKA